MDRESTTPAVHRASDDPLFTAYSVLLDTSNITSVLLDTSNIDFSLHSVKQHADEQRLPREHDAVEQGFRASITRSNRGSARQ